MRQGRLAAGLIAAAMVLTACGGEEGGGAGRSPSSQSPTGPASEVTITMTKGLQFDPAEVTITVGGRVT